MFGARLVRWWPDLRAGLDEVFPPDIVAVLGRRLVESAAAGFVDRDGELKRLDLQRLLEPDWFQHPRMLGYAAYTDRFAGDLRGVGEHLPYLEELGVTYLHLMPLLQPRPSPNDGGYAVADYRAVAPTSGRSTT